MMKCERCGKELSELNHFYVPGRTRSEGKRYCIACAREQGIVTLV